MPSIVQRAKSFLNDERTQTYLKGDGTDLKFDSTISISKDRTANATNHAVEKGSDITDHVTDEPIGVSLTAIISDSDWDPLDPLSFVNKKVKERLSLLYDWMDKKVILAFYSYDEIIENLIIESVSEEQAVDLGDGRKLSLKLKKIVIAEPRKTEVTLKSPVPKTGAAATATKQVSGSAGANKSICGGL
ncbi:phage baseplate protein [Leptospira sp. SA-E8]|uniref:phage baseplate protein n=1 Tax=Leptospira sp. SA-E8 TaxID=3422259 RepID=UPI003EB73604